MIYWPAKGPTEVEDFAFDFSAALSDGENITGTPIVTATGVTKSDVSESAGIVSLWLSGGVEGTVAKVVCTITTDSSPPRTYSELAALEIGGEVVSLADAKVHLRVESEDEDLLIGAYLRAALGLVEARSGKNLRPKIVSQLAPGFPRSSCTDKPIRLWKGPVSEILSIEYDDPNGDAQPLSNFRLVEGSDAQLLPAYGECWPATMCGPGTVRVSYVAGYDATELPPALPLAALLLTAHYYANREAAVVSVGSSTVGELPLGVDALIAPYRTRGLG